MRTNTAGPDWDVFLAYAGPDRARAQVLYRALTSLGLRVFLDREVLKLGDNWNLLLPAHLRASSVVVLLVSEHTEAAHYEQSELVDAVTLVRRERRRLIPVRLVPNIDLPYGTSPFQAADMFDDDVVPSIAEQIAAVVPGRDSAGGQVFCSRVPVVSAFFTGRDDLLGRLASALQDGSTTLVSQAIAGLGGVGKTTVAAAVAEAHRADFDIVWWVRAEDPTVLVDDLAELAPHLDVPQRDDPADTAGLVRERLETTDRTWLVVFDNVPNQQAVERWLPRRGRGSLVITSRSAAFPLAGSVERVDTFPDDIAAEFLRRRVERDNATAAAEDLTPILERLGGLPLALDQAAAWVSQVPNRRFAHFVEAYDDAAREPFPDGTRPTGYEHTATTTWRVSIEAATAQAPLAEKVMAVLGHFAPDEFPCQWLREMSDDPYFAATPAAITEALDALHTYSLATITPADTITMHRVLHWTARRTAPPTAAKTAIHTLARQCRRDAEDHRNWDILTLAAPHVLATAEHASRGLPAAAQALRGALNAIVIYQALSGAVGAAIKSATTAHDIAVAHLGTDHPDTLASRNNLANAYVTAGDLDSAIRLQETNLTDRQRILGNDHPDTLTSRNNLANSYARAGDHAQAIRLNEANLTDMQRILGDDHPNTLISRNNLANSYEGAGDLDRAIRLHETNLTDRQRILGDDHPDTFMSRNNLANAYRSAGNLGKATALYEANLADRQRILGNDHPSTLISRNNLATAYAAAGDLDRAIPLHEINLADRQRILGNDHPDTLNSRNNLAVAYAAAGDLDRAMRLYEANLADTRRILGDDHPQTIASRENLEAAKAKAAKSDDPVGGEAGEGGGS